MAARAAAEAAEAEAAAEEEEEGDGEEPGGRFAAAAAAGDAGSGWDTGLLPSPVGGSKKNCSQYTFYQFYSSFFYLYSCILRAG